MSPATAPARTILGYLQLYHPDYFSKGKTLKKAKNSAGKNVYGKPWKKGLSLSKQPTFELGSKARKLSNIASLIWSAILSGWPSLTDSDVNK